MKEESKEKDQEKKKEMLDKNLELRQLLMKAHARKLLRDRKEKKD